MSAIDVTRWRFGDVAKRLLGGRTSYEPPPNWAYWREPTPALPIDRAITTLRNSDRAPRLRPRETLDARVIACPYYGTRWATAMAVDAATVMARDDPAEMTARWRAHEKAAAESRHGIAAIAESLVRATQMPLSRWPMCVPEDVERTYEQIIRLHRSGGLDRISDQARVQRKFFQNNQGSREQIWRVVFAADLGLTWRALTGNNPARTEPFIAFVAATYDSLDAGPSVSWENPIRRALAMGVDWDRYDKNFPKK
jgi:hypothetical protein